MKKLQIEREVNSGMLTLILVIALALPKLMILACYSSADLYAVEVVLNKSGVKYNLSKLAEMKGVSYVNYFAAYSAYVYKSHYNGRLIVVVSEQGLKYANIHTLVNKPVIVFSMKGLNVTPKQICDNVERVKSELKWDVKENPLPPSLSGKGIEFIFTKTISGAEVKVFISILELASIGESYTVKLGLLVRGVEEMSDELASEIKSEIDDLLDAMKLSQLKRLLKTCMIKTSLVKKLPEQEKYIAVRIQIPLKEEVITIIVHTCDIKYSSKGLNVSKLKFEEAQKLGWKVWVKRAPEDNYVGFIMTKKLKTSANIKDTASLHLEGSGRGNEIHLFLRVEGVDNVNDIIVNEFKDIFKIIGLNGDLVNKCSFQKFEESRGSRLIPAYDISEEEVKEALRIELEWLSKNGIITGLDENDLKAIVSSLRLGYAGWNNRLVWFNGKWVSYRDTEGAVLLRCVGVPPNYFFPEEEIGKSKTKGTGHSSGSNIGVYDIFRRDFKLFLYLAIAMIIASFIAVISHFVIKGKLPIEG